MKNKLRNLAFGLTIFGLAGCLGKKQSVEEEVTLTGVVKSVVIADEENNSYVCGPTNGLELKIDVTKDMDPANKVMRFLSDTLTINLNGLNTCKFPNSYPIAPGDKIVFTLIGGYGKGYYNGKFLYTLEAPYQQARINYYSKE